MSHLKRYWIWTAAYVVAWVGLFWFTEPHLNWPQAALIILAVSFHGASQRNFGRYEVGR